MSLINPENSIFQYGIEFDKKSDGLEPDLSHSKKSCIVSYYWQFSTSNKMFFLPANLAPLDQISGFLSNYPWKAVYNTMR